MENAVEIRTRQPTKQKWLNAAAGHVDALVEGLSDLPSERGSATVKAAQQRRVFDARPSRVCAVIVAILVVGSVLVGVPRLPGLPHPEPAHAAEAVPTTNTGRICSGLEFSGSVGRKSGEANGNRYLIDVPLGETFRITGTATLAGDNIFFLAMKDDGRSTRVQGTVPIDWTMTNNTGAPEMYLVAYPVIGGDMISYH